IVTALFALTFVSWASASETPPIKPVAVCDFNDGETCGWMHEEAVWTHRWEVEQGYLCLKAKMPTLSPKKKNSSWLSGLSTGQRKSPADIRVRFTSPPVPSSFGLRCIAFGYSVDLERGTMDPSDGSFCKSSALLNPLAVCDFDDGETCGWMHEEVPWTYRWVVERDRLCLKAKMSSNFSSKKISWLQGLAIAQSGDETDVKVRFSSPPVPASLGMKCVTLVYLINFGREKTSKPPRVSGSLSLLQQHKGALADKRFRCVTHAFDWSWLPKASQLCRSFCQFLFTPATSITLQTCEASLCTYLNDIFAPFHVWTFEEGDMEDWSNDNNNGQLKWHVATMQQSSFSICASAKTSGKKSKKFSPPTSFSKKTSSRLWSPTISSSFGISCLTIQYAIERAGHDATLSLLQQSSGYLFPNASRPSEITTDSSQTESSGLESKELKAKYLGLLERVATEAKFVGPTTFTSTEMSCFATLYNLGVTVNLPLFHQETAPKPFFVWTFNENTGKWTNDAANWHQKWELVNGAICLHNMSSEPQESDDTMFWLSLNAVNEGITKNSRALLWSPPIPQIVGMRCIEINYWINMGSKNPETYHLAMLQQQTG
ncbi:hypothetical protein TSMEX_006412, partial [Taenia solium]